jgi:hypothetical protein
MGMGGMGGMGMGGMGGMGMGGGMGGMGMGGGFFNVPREVLPLGKPDVKLFAVQPESVAQQPAARPEPAPAKVAAIKLNLAPGADVRQAWETFFAQHEPEKDAARLNQMGPEALKDYQARLVKQQQAVLETVQELKEAVAEAIKHDKTDEATKKHEEIIALIEAALRHEQAQPWMYEILAMSMKAAGRPQDEIDRAIMSAAEFAQNPADLMYLGAYLTQANMDYRALQIYRQVAQVEPLWPEPYFHGMMAARKLHDLPGLEWSTAGILGQAWPPAQAYIWDDAMRVAQATLADLRSHKRNEEADRFEAAVHQALARDCIVKVQWTGDADVDIMVKEPAGTVCSLRNPRTTSGGMLSGDLSSGDKAGIAGHMAVYTCPRAFNGSYQVLIRRVFGKLTTGKVSVELDTHFNTSLAKTLEKKVPLDSGEALVKFDLADGRRKESIQSQQVVNAAVDTVAQTRHLEILAQQIAAVSDPQATAALSVAQQDAAAASAGQAQQINPLAFPAGWPNGLHGAVGYQPVIQVLPSGTSMSATGVVSADRRYVRITCMPIFSQISNVTTFNEGGTSATPATNVSNVGGNVNIGNGGAAGAGGVGGVANPGN